MQNPVTPLKDDYSLDLATFEKVLDFHVRTGAPAISWPHHKGESLNLTIAERKLFAEAAVKVVAGRVPVTVHVSALAVEDTFALARHAQQNRRRRHPRHHALFLDADARGDPRRTAGFAIKKNEPRFTKFVDDTLLDLEKSGEAEKIFNAWFAPVKRPFTIKAD